MPLSIRSITNLNHPLHTIIRYIDENTIDIMQFSSTQRLRPVFFSEENKIRLKKITNVLGQVVGNKTNTILFYIYDNGLVEKY